MPAQIKRGRILKRKAHPRHQGPCAFVRRLARDAARLEMLSKLKSKRLDEDCEVFHDNLKKRAIEGEVSWHTAIQEAQRYSQLQETVRRVQKEINKDVQEFLKEAVHDCMCHGCSPCPLDPAAAVEGA